LKTQEKSFSFEMIISWLFLVCISILAINQIVSETRIFNWPNYEIYRTFMIAAYSLGVLMVFLHLLQGDVSVRNINFTILIVMSFIFISNILNNVSFDDFFTSTCWAIAFMAGYCFERHGVFRRLFKLRVLIFIIITIFAFLSMHDNFSREHGTTNIIGVNYIFYFGFPLFLWIVSKSGTKMEWILSAIFVVAVIMSFKRTSFIAIVLALVLYFFFKYACRNSIKMQMVFVFTIIAFILLANFMNNYTDGRLFERFSDIEDTGGNGRLDIWEATIAAFNKAPFGNKIFGSGFNGVIRSSYVRQSAHNDFLEILFDYGILALVLYAYIVFNILAQAIRSRKTNPQLFPLFIAVFVMFMVFSSFSHVILYAYVAFPIFYLLGGLYAISLNDGEGRIKNGSFSCLQ